MGEAVVLCMYAENWFYYIFYIHTSVCIYVYMYVRMYLMRINILIYECIMHADDHYD